MTSYRPFSKFVLTGACLFGSWAGSDPAIAQDKSECANAAEQGQVLRDERHLLKARTKFLLCANEVCPKVVRNDCKSWLSDIDARTPSLVFKARAGDHPLDNVRVFMDGDRLTEGLDRQPTLVEPGMHAFRFETDGHRPIEETLMIYEREHERTLTAIFESERTADEGSVAPAPATTRPNRNGRTAAFVLGGIGVLAAGSALYFGITGLKETTDYHDGCAHIGTCSKSDVDATRTKLLFADISGGIAIVAGGVAAYLFFRNTSSPKDQAKGIHPRLMLGPIPGGGSAAVAGQF